MRNHKIYLFSLVILSLFFSCDDGNIITTTFDFDEETSLSLCQQGDVNVLHFIDPETNEAISFKFSGEDFDGTFDGLEPSQTVTLNINATNQIVYRRLSASANGNTYFCQQIPPSTPQVIEEFVSTTGGTATLEINALFGLVNEQDDDDGDGVSNLLEDLNGDGNLFNDDTDDDGIPDFLDTDDDNDNVPTESEELEADEEDEIVVEINGVFYVDTDGDSIPNFRDNDDDGDGVLTLNEDLNVCIDPENPALNPTNDLNEEGLANYLNAAISESVDLNVVKVNTITLPYLTQVVFNDITFENQNSEESLTFTSFVMGRYTTSASQNLPFNDGIISEEDAGNFCQ